jgi:rhodanese-related sulfurtransferase
MSSDIENLTTVPSPPQIHREELRRRLHDQSLTIVDVLSPQSYASGHIPGAVNLPFEDIEAHAHELLPDSLAEIAVYCSKFT